MARASPDGRIELVDVAVGLDPRVVLADPTAAEETGLSLVAGPGVDLHAGKRLADATSAQLKST